MSEELEIRLASPWISFHGGGTEHNPSCKDRQNAATLTETFFD
jgi:hypothetical protein